MKNEVGIEENLVVIKYKITSVHLFQTFSPPRSLNIKIYTRRSEEKSYCLENYAQDSVFILLIKALAEQPVCNNCVSLCSLCEGK